MGYEPRVAMLAYSTFGHPPGERSEKVREAVKILDKRRVDFEYDGEMAADVALNTEGDGAVSVLPPVGPANVLVMPAFHSASISTKMLQELGGSTVIGPLLVGLNKPVQIVSLRRQGCRHRQHGGQAWRRFIDIAAYNACDLLQMLHELKPSKCIFGLQQTRRNPSSGSAAT
jgi:phosphotransacetylase